MSFKLPLFANIKSENLIVFIEIASVNQYERVHFGCDNFYWNYEDTSKNYREETFAFTLEY